MRVMEFYVLRKQDVGTWSNFTHNAPVTLLCLVKAVRNLKKVPFNMLFIHFCALSLPGSGLAMTVLFYGL